MPLVLQEDDMVQTTRREALHSPLGIGCGDQCAQA